MYPVWLLPSTWTSSGRDSSSSYNEWIFNMFMSKKHTIHMAESIKMSLFCPSFKECF